MPFRTWRNSITEEASEKLTELFQYNIPQRWSIAHLYQAILNGEEHVPQIDFLTTLDGYVHWKLTGEKTLGIGEASGMFPIDSETKTYRQDMMDKFEALIAEKTLSVEAVGDPAEGSGGRRACRDADRGRSPASGCVPEIWKREFRSVLPRATQGQVWLRQTA